MTILDEITTRRNGTQLADGEAAEQPARPHGVDGPAGEPERVAPAVPVGAEVGRALMVIRIVALLITGLVGVAAAVLSFASLADLAARAGYPAQLSYLWPAIVDGTILLSTMAIVVLGPHGQLQRANRRFFWLVLSTAAVVSVGGNVVHALLPHDAPLPYWLAIPIAAVAPLSLLADVHGATILSRLHSPKAMSTNMVRWGAPEERSPRWDAIAALVQDRNPNQRAVAELSVSEIGDVLRRLDGGESQRSIGRDTGLHHRTIRLIVETGAEVRERIESAEDTRDM